MTVSKLVNFSLWTPDDLQSWEELAQDAKPRGEGDYGSSRQTTLQNLFFCLMDGAFPHIMKDDATPFSQYCYKATSEEMLDEAVRLIRQEYAKPDEPTAPPAPPKPQWIRECGERFQVPDDIPAGFVDISWHNDVCPSFWHDTACLKLWVDDPDPTQREIGGMCRFLLVPTNPDSSDATEMLLFETDDWQAMKERIALAVNYPGLALSMAPAQQHP